MDRSRTDVRRRRAALGALAATALVAGTAVGASDGEDAGSPPVGSAPSRGVAASERLPLAQAVGNRVVTRMSGTTPSARLLARVRRGEVAGVILFADNVRSLDGVRAATRRLQAAARAGGRPPVLVMADQEGGLVKRFRSLPPTRSALRIGDATRRVTLARAEGRATARALVGIGVGVDLAPVVDVPTSRRSFLRTRAYGTTTSRVTAAGCAFADGLVAGGAVPTLKHFPGLGRAGANTDDASVRITASRATITAGLAPYRRCGGGAGRLVMVASAIYPALGGREPAVLERRTYALLRDTVGARAPLTVSDDLQTPALAGQSDVAVRAARAGLDLLLYAKTERGSEDAYGRLLSAARSGRLDRAALDAAARRIDALRRSAATG